MTYTDNNIQGQNNNLNHHPNTNAANQIDENGYLKDLYLAKDTEVVHTWETKGGNHVTEVYKVVQHINSGGFANTYLVKKEGDNRLCVLKELCTSEARRRPNYSLEMDFDQEILNKFIKEPERIYKLLKFGKGRATCVTDSMTFDEAKRASRKEVGIGGVFEWNGSVYSNYEDYEKEQLNLVMPITPHFEWCSNHYYVMQYVTGTSLAHFMAIMEKHGKIELDIALQVMEQLAIAVCNLHDINCIHQDLSANNILVDFDANYKIKLKIIDFGLATDLDRLYNNNGESGTVMLIGGTPGFTDIDTGNYMIHKKNEKLIDIYSLGANLFFMVFWKDYSSFNGYLMQNEIKNMRFKKKEIIERAKSKYKEDNNYPNLIEEFFNLVMDSTIYNENGFKDRIQSADYFLNRIRTLMIPIKSNGSIIKESLKRVAFFATALLGNHFLNGDDSDLSDEFDSFAESDDSTGNFVELMANMEDFGDNYNIFSGPSIDISKEDIDDLDFDWES